MLFPFRKKWTYSSRDRFLYAAMHDDVQLLRELFDKGVTKQRKLKFDAFRAAFKNVALKSLKFLSEKISLGKWKVSFLSSHYASSLPNERGLALILLAEQNETQAVKKLLEKKNIPDHFKDLALLKAALAGLNKGRQNMVSLISTSENSYFKMLNFVQENGIPSLKWLAAKQLEKELEDHIKADFKFEQAKSKASCA